MMLVVVVNCQLDVQGERHCRLSLRKGEGVGEGLSWQSAQSNPSPSSSPLLPGERREKDTGCTVLKGAPIEILRFVVLKAEKSPIVSNLGSGFSFILIPEPSINEQDR